MLVEVKVKPNSNENKIEFVGGKFVIYLAEPAEKGKANRALLKLLQKTFGSARLVSGATSKKKIVELPQKNLEEAKKYLSAECI